MNLFKLYAVFLLVLLLYTVDSNGSIILALLVKLIALKGALFIGTPIALGSFLVGQGIGFFAGNLAGGYAVLKAAQKYHEKEKKKWVEPTIVTYHNHGWKSPYFKTGYRKGIGVGNVLSQFLKNKYKPSYNDYYHDFGGYHDTSYGYMSGHLPTDYHHSSHGYSNGGYSPGYSSAGYPSSISGIHSGFSPYGSYSSPYSIPSYNSYSSHSYGGYPSPSYSHYPSYYPPPKKPTLIERVMSKLPTFLGGKSKGEEFNEYYNSHSPVFYSDGSYASNFETYTQPPVENPMNTYYPYKSTHLPGQSYTPPKDPSTEYEEYKDTVKDTLAPVNIDNPTSAEEPVSMFEDSEYTYSSSPYAKPRPKKPESGETFQNYEFGDSDYNPIGEVYDGPAKQFTGVMTDIFETIQKSRPKSYGHPKGKPIGIGEYSPSSTYTYGSDNVNEASSILQQYAEDRRDKLDRLIPKSKAAPNIFLEKFLEKKLEEEARKAKDTEHRKEAKELINLLRKAYLQQLAESLKPDAGEKDDEEEEEVDEAYEEDYPMVSNSVPNSTGPTSVPKISTTTSTKLKPTSSPVTTEKTKFVQVNWIPRSSITRNKREDPKIDSKSPQIQKPESVNPLLSLTSEQLEQVQLLYTFIEEIKQFFTLVSALDEDTCLQKMVCDVHAKPVTGDDEPSMTTYESNMISTFNPQARRKFRRIMDSIVPYDPSAPVDSSTKYRLAAKIGGISGSTDTCQRYYSACAYTTNQIISLGNQVAGASTTESSVNFNQDEKLGSMTSLSPGSIFVSDRQQRREDTYELMPKV